MDRLYRTVVQLEEAKRFILDGDGERLRLALILLDNAVEVIMNRFIDGELANARVYARLLEMLPIGSPDTKIETLRREIKINTIPSRRQRNIERSFDEKLKFLSNDRGRLPSPTARALRHLHKYRNETQHHDMIREGSIRPAVLVLFDIALDILVSLHQSKVWASNEDYGWLLRYDLSDTSSTQGVHDNLESRIATKLRSGLQLDIVGIRRALVEHLTDRLDEMNNWLKYVSTNLPFGPDPARTLKAIQFSYHLQHPCSISDVRRKFQAFEPTYNLASFTKWRTATKNLNSIDRLVMFGEFATIEDEFEPLEAMIDEASSAIDRSIQEQIDLMRGK